MPRCIYCQEDKSQKSFRSVEHVLPQSFGMFRNNFTLRGIVCDSCNLYFGNSLDIVLARDSIEGHSRFSHGVKNPEEFRPFGRNTRLVIRFGEGEFVGAYAYREYSRELKTIIARVPPQVGFLIAQLGKYEYFLLDELPTKEDLSAKGFDLDSHHPKAILGLATDAKQLQDRLAAKGIAFNPGGDIVPLQRSNSVLCELEGTIDQEIFRAIAKIAFNYLAYWQDAEFLSAPSFDLVRRYIRYGESPAYKFVDMRQEAILGDEPVVGQRRLGHLITVDWAQDHVSILAQVSLFNWVTYGVSLAREYPGQRRDIQHGHLFNVTNGEILELEAR